MSAIRATSIRLFLAEGTPDGLWVVEKSNWTGIGLVASRAGYSSLRARSELDGPGIYVLVGPAERGALANRVYVGETDVLRSRLDQHVKSKDFWTRVIVLTSKDSNLNKAHVRYLESRLLSLAASAKRSELENSSVSAVPSLSEADRADMEAFLDDMLLLYPVVGLTAFESTSARDDAGGSESDVELQLSGKGTMATGREAGDGFIVDGGSLARGDTVPSMHQYAIDLREGLLAEGVFEVVGQQL